MASFSEWRRRGNAMVWLSGATLALSLVMISGLVGYIAVKGLGYFWPRALVQATTPDGKVLGEISGTEAAQGEDGAKIQLHVGNRDLYGQDFRWIPRQDFQDPQTPKDVVLVERLEYGIFLGRLVKMQRLGQGLAEGEGALAEAQKALPAARAISERILEVERQQVGELNRKLEALRLEKRSAERQQRQDRLAELSLREQALSEAYNQVQIKLEALRTEANALTITLESADGQSKEMPLASVVRFVPANALSTLGKARVYLARIWEFLADPPRESNTEGGIFPAIFGTVMMVMIMSLMVVPLGVMAALYLREYARQGWVVRMVRVAVNNLAGVPSIVFGIFGLGFFVYSVGGTLDQLFFSDHLPAPTYGTGGILWASLTLALLTVPVVIVSTEEALSSVPRSQREASLALGATKWQTLWKVVLPGATPGILTGLILAMARGAGEVAPLMLTGVVKLAPSMPLDGQFPFLHLDRKFMHLGFHIYDVGFQSPNSEAAKPMVFMTALLLLLVVLVLNIAALRIRSRLRARLGSSAF